MIKSYVSVIGVSCLLMPVCLFLVYFFLFLLIFCCFVFAVVLAFISISGSGCSYSYLFFIISFNIKSTFTALPILFLAWFSI